MQESWAWSRVKAICIDGAVVSTSDSESFGPGSIPGGRISNFFPFFPFFLLEVITFLLFFLLISKSTDISK